jgi:D-xylose reductase
MTFFFSDHNINITFIFFPLSRKMNTQSYITLTRTGDKMPLAGFGTARIPAEETAEVVYNAIKTGYRLIDGALFYDNEAQVGEGVRRAISEGIVKREDLFSKF